MRKPTHRSPFIRPSLANGILHDLADLTDAGLDVPALDDPAVVVGLAAQYAHLGEAGSRLPEPLLQRLRRLAHGGDPAARLMLRMLVGRGKAPRAVLFPDTASGNSAGPSKREAR